MGLALGHRLERALPRVLDHLRAWVNDASEDDMMLMLNALQVKIKASNEEVHIEGVIPVSEAQGLGQEDQELVTIERTLGCVFTCAKPAHVPDMPFIGIFTLIEPN